MLSHFIEELTLYITRFLFSSFVIADIIIIFYFSACTLECGLFGLIFLYLHDSIFLRNKFRFKEIWQYILNLSYLKERLKWYINFPYNYSVSCLVFEINRLILIKSSFIPPSWICIRCAYVTSRVKAKVLSCKQHVIINYCMKLDFPKFFWTQLTHNIFKMLFEEI
jgi:hypothetical protein